MKSKMKYLKYIFAIIITVFICFFEFPYYIDAPGGLDNLNKKVKVEDSYDADGSINLTYVKELKATLPFLLLATINPDWNIEKKTSVNIGTLDYEKYMNREKVLMKQSYTSAIKFAYEKAKKDVNVDEEKCYAIYVFEDAKTDINVGDQILSIDGNKIEKCSEISNYVKTKSENDTSLILVDNNGKQYERNVTYNNFDGQIAIGIQIGIEYVLTTTPKYHLDFDANEYGPSGGLMIALAVYNSLVPTDITGGEKIAGTGTLDSNGNVGEIGGIEYKLKGAVKGGAKIFFAPTGENYEEAKKIKEKKKYKIDVVEVKTFDDALEYLENNIVKK